MVRVFATAILAATLAWISPATAQQAVGIAAGVRNDVRIKKPNTALPPRPVQLKQRVSLGDGVQTGAKSQLQLLLLDRSVFTVGANARLTIDRYVYDPNRNSRSLGATVSRGAFRFMSGRPDRGNSTTINTPVAAIGVRGTSFDCVLGQTAIMIASGERGVGNVHADPATASLIILRGPGGRTQGNTIPGAIDITAGGRTVSVDRPLYAVFVPGPGRAPIGPFRVSNAGLMQVQALIFPSVADRLGLRGPADNLGGDPDSVYYPPTNEGPNYPRRGNRPPGTLESGPPVYTPQSPFGTVPSLPPAGPRPQGQGPRQQGAPAGAQAPAGVPQGGAAKAQDPGLAPQGSPAKAQGAAAAPDNAPPPKNSLAPPDPKASPAFVAPAQSPNDSGQQPPPKGKGKPQDPPKPGPQ